MPSSGYVAWSVVADEQPTTAKWNLIGSNMASFNNGNGFEDSIILARHIAANVINSSKIDWAASTGKIWYEELGRSVGANPSLTSIPAKTHLRIILHVINATGNSSSNLRFNNDSAANYAQNRTSGDTINATSLGTGNSTMDQYNVIDIVNIANREKLTNWYTTFRNNLGAGNAPIWDRLQGKWVNTTNQITRIDYFNAGGGTNGADTQMIVLGHD